MQNKTSVRDVFNQELLKNKLVQDVLNDAIRQHINYNLDDLLDRLEFQYQRSLIKSDRLEDIANKLSYDSNLTEEQLLMVDTAGYTDAMVENLYCNGKIYDADESLTECRKQFFKKAGVALVELRPHDIDLVLHSNKGTVTIRSDNFPEWDNSLISIDDLKDSTLTRTTFMFDNFKHHYQGLDASQCIKTDRSIYYDLLAPADDYIKDEFIK